LALIPHVVVISTTIQSRQPLGDQEYV